MLMKNKQIVKRFSLDVAINVIANVIPVIILQLIIQPIIAKKIGAEDNGLFITILALIHFVVPTTSAALCNSRLLFSTQKREEKGDYNIYLALFSVLNLFVIVVGSLLYIRNASLIDVLLISLLSVIWMWKDYLIVDFRINLNFTNILINNIILSIGLLIGLLFFYCLNLNWYVIFLCGYILSFIHAFIKTDLIQEPIKRTRLFSNLTKVIWPIVFANIFGMLAVNFDRLILFPLVGGTLVSIYYSASIIGKLISLISSPISNVFLSYIVRIDAFTIRKLNVLYLVMFVGGLFFYIICILASPFLLNMLYPLWAKESIVLVPITSAVAVFDLIISITNPIVMRFCDINYQIIIQLAYLVIYAISGFLFYNIWGLLGFAFAVLTSSVVKVILIYLIARMKMFSFK